MAWAKAFICGCASLALAPEERAFLQRERPWGVILFRRNVGDRAQLKNLVEEIRQSLGRADAPVLVDQEGGRVQRMAAPHWPTYPAAGTIGGLPGGHSAQEEAAWLAARLIAEDLREVGVTVNCMPVLDVPVAEAHSVIGDRAYSHDPQRVAALGAAAVKGLLAGGVLPVVKHIPGHGRAKADSHLELPVVRDDAAALRAKDFAPFVELADAPLAMTAHVVYAAIDPDRPATLSAKVISEWVRGAIGFEGLLMTDDLSMHALSGPFEARARAAFEAGVDIALHCNGDLAEAQAVARASPELDGHSLARAERALGLIAAGPQRLDLVDARERLQSLLARAA